MDRFRCHSLELRSIASAPTEAGAWLRSLASHHGLGEERSFQLELCAEEILTNIVKFAYADQVGTIRVRVLLDLDTVALTVIDEGRAFDPLSRDAPALPASISEAPCGGLGIHLVRQIAKDIRYDRWNGRNRLTVQLGDELPELRGEDRRQDGEPPAYPVGDDKTDYARERESERRSGVDRRSLGFVSRTAMFRNMGYRDLEALLAHCVVRSFAAGDILLRAGENHRCVLIGIEGTIEVHLDAHDSSFHIDFGPGECFGEMSVADDKANSAWVTGSSSGRVLVVPADVFLEDFLSVPTIARNLIVVMAERMRRSSQQIVARLRASMELEMLQRDLDVARDIQLNMLPAEPIFPPGASIHGRGFMRAARQVGGDFYDVFRIDDDRYFLAIGDVCGKGMSAALFMVRVLTLLRNIALGVPSAMAACLAQIAARCNDQLNESNPAQQFVTLFCAIVDVSRDRLDFVNLGHNPPLVRLSGETPAFVEQPKNPLAGLFPGISYRTGSLHFPAGSLLLLYTDGVTEAECESASQFGEEPLRALLAQETGETVEACIDRIVSAVDAFSAGREQSDDITLLAVRRT